MPFKSDCAFLQQKCLEALRDRLGREEDGRKEVGQEDTGPRWGLALMSHFLPPVQGNVS